MKKGRHDSKKMEGMMVLMKMLCFLWFGDG